MSIIGTIKLKTFVDSLSGPTSVSMVIKLIKSGFMVGMTTKGEARDQATCRPGASKRASERPENEEKGKMRDKDDIII